MSSKVMLARGDAAVREFHHPGKSESHNRCFSKNIRRDCRPRSTHAQWFPRADSKEASRLASGDWLSQAKDQVEPRLPPRRGEATQFEEDLTHLQGCLPLLLEAHLHTEVHPLRASPSLSRLLLEFSVQDYKALPRTPNLLRCDRRWQLVVLPSKEPALQRPGQLLRRPSVCTEPLSPDQLRPSVKTPSCMCCHDSCRNDAHSESVLLLFSP